jgi:hypothetical protein
MSTSMVPKKLMFSLCAGEMWARTSSSMRRPAARSVVLPGAVLVEPSVDVCPLDLLLRGQRREGGRGQEGVLGGQAGEALDDGAAQAAHAAGIPRDDVEPVDYLGREAAEQSRQEDRSLVARSSRIKEHGADTAARVGGRVLDQAELDLPPARIGVIQGHRHRGALEPCQAGVPGLGGRARRPLEMGDRRPVWLAVAADPYAAGKTMVAAPAKTPDTTMARRLVRNRIFCI